MTYIAGCIFEAGTSFFSIAGLTVGKIGSVGDEGPDLTTSAEIRSFSMSAAPMLAFEIWWKNEWISNGRDRGKLPARNTVAGLVD